MRLPTSLRTYSLEARSAFVHAPIEVILGMALAATFSLAVRQSDGADWWARVAVGVALAMPVVFGLSVLRARGVVPGTARWGASVLVLAVVGAYAAWIFDPDLGAERWRAAALVAAAVLGLALVPVPGGGARERVRHRVWSFSVELLLRVAGVAAYGALLYAALAGAVAAVSNLFELRTPEHLFADLAGLVFFALVPWVVAGGVPALATAADGPTPRETRQDSTTAGDGRFRFAALLGRFLYMPVIGIYLLILYAYTVKVVGTGELPRNLLSPIILFAGFAGFFGAVLLDPVHREDGPRGVSRMVRAFPLLLLPLLPLAVWAVGLRLAQHGWTEFRYLRFALLLALGLLAIGGAIRLARRRPPLLLAIPATIAAVLFLSSVGPWSAVAMSRRDQQARLREALVEARLLDTGGGALSIPDSTTPPRLLPAEAYDRVAGSAMYLFKAHGSSSLRAVVNGADRYASGWDLIGALRIEAGCEPQQVRHASVSLPHGAGIPGLPAGTLYRLNAGEREGTLPTSGLAMRARGSLLEVTHTGSGERWSARLELAELLRSVAARSVEGCGPAYRSLPAQLHLDEAVHQLTDAAGRERGTLVLTSLALRWDSTASALIVRHAESLVVVR